MLKKQKHFFFLNKIEISLNVSQHGKTYNGGYINAENNQNGNKNNNYNYNELDFFVRDKRTLTHWFVFRHGKKWFINRKINFFLFC